jgi:DNA invertase Pin-like site-specific DNA recombinase
MRRSLTKTGRRLRLITYARVSTDRQAEEGAGLEVQVRAMRAWARSHGHRIVEIVEVVRDEGMSGTLDAADRPALTAALEAVEGGRADGLVVHRLDRLGRSLTTLEAVSVKVWSMGGRVFTVDLGEVDRDDPTDPMRTALRQIVGVLAQLERGMITARMKAARALKAEAGGYAGEGSPPFGWRAEAASWWRTMKSRRCSSEHATCRRGVSACVRLRGD